MNKLLLTLCLSSLLPIAARADGPVPTVQLKQRSSFDAADARDPFWPIGWKKPGPKNVASDAGPELSPDSFSLTSVTMGSGPHFAILNGKIIQEGQQFGLQFGHQIYQITLRAIEDGKVILAYQDAEIEVPLRRR